MRSTFTLLAALTLLSSTSVLAQWEPLNVGGTGNRSVTTFGGSIFVAAPPVGVRKSSNDGATWTLANTGLPVSGSNVNVRSVGRSATALFCGTESGVFRSTDNGASWLNVNGALPTASATIYCDKIFTFGTATFVVFTGQLSQNGGGVFRTFDNGATWLQAYSGLSSNMVVNNLAEVNGVLYAATNTALMRSDDLGGSWQPAGTTNWAVQSVQGSNGTLVILGAFGAQRSTNNGTTWTASTGYPTTNCPVGSELIVFDGQFYAITKTGASGCFRSADNGATWTAYNDGLSTQNTFVQDEFHVSATHLYIACALDCYRIESTTTALPSDLALQLPKPQPTAFADHFVLDLATLNGDHRVIMLDAAGREVARHTVYGGQVNRLERGGLTAGRYHCLLQEVSTGIIHPIGQVFAE